MSKDFESGMTFKAVRADHLFDHNELANLDTVVAHWNATAKMSEPWTRKRVLQVLVNIALREELKNVWLEKEAA